jgi:hypothetical protein
MTSSSPKTPNPDPPSSAGHAWLARVALSELERAALERNGRISAEWRGRKLRYKLRFRAGGKQHVRYLGSDPVLAASVISALAELRRPKRAIAHLKKLCRAGWRSLRAEKRHIAPLLAVRGLAFHGHRLRRSRSIAKGVRGPTTQSSDNEESASATGIRTEFWRRRSSDPRSLNVR